MTKQKENTGSKINLKDGISLISPFIPLIVKILDKSCDNLLLTWVLFAVLFCSLVFVLFRLSYKLKHRTRFVKSFVYVICGLIYFALGWFLLFTKCDNLKTSNSFTSSNSPITNRVDKSTTNNDNSVRIEDNRKTYNFKKPSTRKLNKFDIEKLKLELPELDAKIIVQYLKTNSEDSLLWKRVLQILKESGYSNIVHSEASILPNDLTEGNITISKVIINQQIVYKVIINPQH